MVDFVAGCIANWFDVGVARQICQALADRDMIAAVNGISEVVPLGDCSMIGQYYGDESQHLTGKMFKYDD